MGTGEKEGSVFFLYALKAVDKAWKIGGPEAVKLVDYTVLAKKKGGAGKIANASANMAMLHGHGVDQVGSGGEDMDSPGSQIQHESVGVVGEGV